MTKPFVPPDLDLRNFDKMPLNVKALPKSEFIALANPEEFRAGLLLWCAAWHEVPASSLPNDDRLLARAAGYGFDLKGWAKVKQQAMHNFELCDDGRYYHPIIADLALEAARHKKRNDERTKNATEAKARKRGQRDGQRDDGNNTGQHERNVHQGKGIEKKGREEEDSEETNVSSAGLPAGKVDSGENGKVEDKPQWWPARDRYGRITSEVTEKICFDVGKAILGKNAGGQISKLRKFYHGNLRDVTDMLMQAEDKSDPREWIAGVIHKAEIGERPYTNGEAYPEREYR